MIGFISITNKLLSRAFTSIALEAFSSVQVDVPGNKLDHKVLAKSNANPRQTIPNTTANFIRFASPAARAFRLRFRLVDR